MDDDLYTEPALLETVTFPLNPSEEEKKLSEAENEKNIQVYSAAIATAAAAEAAVAAANAAAEVVRLTNIVCKSKEEISAIKIQAVFRGYLVRYTHIYIYIFFVYISYLFNHMIIFHTG